VTQNMGFNAKSTWHQRC